VIEGQIMAAVDVEGLVRQTTGTLLNGMRTYREASSDAKPADA
jgi:hypothetical protein